MKKIIILLILLISIQAHSQERDVEWMLGTLIETDSIHPIDNAATRLGFTYHFGIHHLKIVKHNSNTLIVARVFDMLEEYSEFQENFSLKHGEQYGFIVSKYSPCWGDFPRLTGACDYGVFYPEKSSLIKSYDKIFRIIQIWPFNK